ncbi:hypothetical protein HDU88_008236 [Geranomyces variabilis]|nr:hypothetical protein HDU88_008236 [Geranomyces variabilis]
MHLPLEVITIIVQMVEDPNERYELCYQLRLPHVYRNCLTSIKEHSVAHASARGTIGLLRWLLSNGQKLQCPENAIDVASKCGLTDVLQVWKDSGIKMRYSRFAMHAASEAGDIKCLDWWAASGLELKYSKTEIVEYCRLNGRVRNWWRDAVPEVFGQLV